MIQNELIFNICHDSENRDIFVNYVLGLTAGHFLKLIQHEAYETILAIRNHVTITSIILNHQIRVTMATNIQGRNYDTLC